MSKTLKIAIVTPNYPTLDSSSFAFVHARAKIYRKNDVQLKVFVLSKVSEDYIFEEIEITKRPKKEFQNAINGFNPNVIAIHYPTYDIIHGVANLLYPKIAWIHGHEILWNFQLGSSNGLFEYFFKRLVFFPREFYQKVLIRWFLKRINHNIFVSHWLLSIAQKHTFTRYENSTIISNPVDCNLFNYTKPVHFEKAISLRGLDSKKYGIDVGIRAYSKKTNSHLTIVGKGKYKDKYCRLIKRKSSNAVIIEKSIPHGKLPEFYKDYGFFVAPSRIEAQGLAMCEAMACGLPVVSTDVGGIPEFVRDGIDGFLVPKNDHVALHKAVDRLLADKKYFIEMSKNARENIINNCSVDKVVKKELKILANHAQYLK